MPHLAGVAVVGGARGGHDVSAGEVGAIVVGAGHALGQVYLASHVHGLCSRGDVAQLLHTHLHKEETCICIYLTQQ